jgi:hypothetical protein
MQHIAQTAFDFKVDVPSPLEMFKSRAKAVAARVSNHMLADKPSAMDGLWRFAEAHGLVRLLGVDEVQRLLSEAFDQC